MQNEREFMVKYDGFSNKFLDEFFSRSLLQSTITPFKILQGANY